MSKSDTTIPPQYDGILSTIIALNVRQFVELNHCKDSGGFSIMLFSANNALEFPNYMLNVP